MKKTWALLFIGLLNACVILNGNYEVKAYDEQGRLIKNNIRMMAQGSGIYTAKNSLCSFYPNATLKVINTDTGEEVKSEARRCRLAPRNLPQVAE
ncbi:hypothetical protein [Snodgrassella sp. CFCC 13594]|uniref:hypothetical protein n=1 Tax=Snodgrassella sp. CFCC 13594 TaxID=1775559 RepID=UPI000834B8AB|nr:hypothetical protein [Snodgrassella sp. CFCC 13594]